MTMPTGWRCAATRAAARPLEGAMSNAHAYATYARVSGDRQEKEKSIETQLFSIRQGCNPQGRPLHAEYLDNPFTGTVLHRPALDRCLADAFAGKFDLLFIDHPDRLSRGESWHLGVLVSLF